MLFFFRNSGLYFGYPYFSSMHVSDLPLDVIKDPDARWTDKLDKSPIFDKRGG